MAEPLKVRPTRGGFLRPFGCGEFIKAFLLGKGPFGSPRIEPAVGACQSDIFHHYKMAILQQRAMDRAIRQEEKQARREKRAIDPDRIEAQADRFLKNLPYKSSSCRYHSFVVYFSNLQRLGWVEPTGLEEPSAFQDHYVSGQPRRYYRLTESGRSAPENAWANPRLALYGRKDFHDQD